MPGKHAPKSPVSFYLSLSRAAAGAGGAVALVVMLTLVALGNQDPKKEADAGPVITTGSPAPSFTPTPAASVSPSPSPSARPRSQVRVSVLNAAARAGLASNVAGDVRAVGWNVANVGNASSLSETSIIFYKPGYLKEAQQLQKQFPAFTRVEPSPERYTHHITLLLGKDYPRQS